MDQRQQATRFKPQLTYNLLGPTDQPHSRLHYVDDRLVRPVPFLHPQQTLLPEHEIIIYTQNGV